MPLQELSTKIIHLTDGLTVNTKSNTPITSLLYTYQSSKLHLKNKKKLRHFNKLKYFFTAESIHLYYILPRGKKR
jgi:hypothetical protein